MSHLVKRRRLLCARQEVLTVENRRAKWKVVGKFGELLRLVLLSATPTPRLALCDCFSFILGTKARPGGEKDAARVSE